MTAEAPTGQERSLDPASRLVMLGGGLLSALALTAINSVLPQIEDALGGGQGDSLLVKQLIGGVGLAMVLGSAISGFLVDRLGLGRVIAIASVLYLAAGTAGLYLDDLTLLLVSRLILGLSAACIQVASLTLINRRLEGTARARWMGLHVSIAMIGTILVHPIAGHLGEVSWRYPFALYGVGAGLLVAMIFSRLPSEVPAPREPARPTGRGLLNGLADLRWFPFHYLLLAFLVGSLVFLPNVYLPFILREFGATPALISYVLTAESVTGSVMAMLYGAARKRISHRVAFLFSFACVASGTLLAVNGASLGGVVAGMLVFGVGVGWLVANVMTALGSKVGMERQGRAAGFVKAAHFLSAPVTVALVEPFARVNGPAVVLVIVAAIAAALSVAMLARIMALRARDGRAENGGGEQLGGEAGTMPTV